MYKSEGSSSGSMLVGAHGFITRPTREDIFVNASAIRQIDNAIDGGEQVEYVVSIGPRGIEAENVRRVIARSQ